MLIDSYLKQQTISNSLKSAVDAAKDLPFDQLGDAAKKAIMGSDKLLTSPVANMTSKLGEMTGPMSSMVKSAMDNVGSYVPATDEFGKLITGEGGIPLTKMAGFNANSLFKNPAGDAQKEADDLKSVMSQFSSAVGMIPGMGGVLSGVTSKFDDMGDTFKSMNTELADKMSNLSTELPIMLAANEKIEQVKTIDALASGQQPSKDEAVNAAFPGKNKCPGFDLKAAFAPITEAASIVAKAVKDMFAPIKDMFQNVFGIVADSVSALKDAIGGLVSKIMSGASDIISSITSKLSGAISGITGAISGALSGIGESFGMLVDAAKKVVGEAVGFLKNLNFLNFLNSTNPCVKQVMDAVVNPEKVDRTALVVAQNPQAIFSPINNGIAVAKAAKDVPPVETTNTQQPVPAPEAVSNMYNQVDKVELYKKVMAIEEDLEEVEKVAAKKYAELDEWKEANNYMKIRADAGYSVENPDGTTTDLALKKQWITLRDQFKPKAFAYNNTEGKAVKEARKKVQDAKREYGVRSIHGKTPYTTMEANNYTLPDGFEKTTLLDSGL